MPLVCVCGRAGCGKSRAIAQYVREAIESGHRAYVLVPDQFTLDAEHLLMQNMGSSGLLSAEVLSFSRLVSRVLEECGQPKGDVLDARGRAMMVSRALSDRKEELVAFPRYTHSPHFSAALSDQIAEFKRFDIKAEDLLNVASDQPRLKDIGTVYLTYQNLMRGVYTDNEDRINWMIERLPEAAFLRDAFVFIDEFEMLTSQVYRIIEALLKTARKVYATFRLCPNGDADEPLFVLERKHLERMEHIAENLGDTVETVWLPLPNTPTRHTTKSALGHLERNLFAQKPSAHPGKTDDVQLLTAPTMQRECEECARRILSLVRDDGYRFSDIAVVASDLSDYGPLLRQAFLSFGIPSFLDIKRSIATHPLPRYILQSLRFCLGNFASRDVIPLVKTGLSPLNPEQADEFEQLVKVSGMRYLAVSDADLYVRYPKLLEYRTALSAHDELAKSLKSGRDAKSLSSALLTFMEKDGLVLRLNRRLQSLEEDGDADAAMELRQAFSVLCSLLSQMGTVMGAIPLSQRAFYDELNAGLCAEEVGVLPTCADAVQVGTVGRSRSADIRALFFLGFNEGRIPRAVGDNGLLLSQDERLLADHALFMGNSLQERLVEERMTLYALLFKPSELLVLSYPQSDVQGAQLMPSQLLQPLAVCLPDLSIQSVENTPETQIQTCDSTLLPLSHALRLSMALHTPLDPAYERALSALCPCLPETVRAWFEQGLPQEQDIGQTLAKETYPDVLTGSATSLEAMARCPFLHFATYALLQPPSAKPYGHTQADSGTYFHDLADAYLERLSSLDVPLSEFTKQQSDKLLDALCADYDDRVFLTGAYQRDGRERHLAHWHRMRLKNDCWQMKKQLQKDGFAPVSMETTFERPLTLPDGRVAKVRGRIDRVDAAMLDGKRVVRVIDYKTGNASFSYTDLYCGTALQLPLYSVTAAEKAGGQSVGMFMQQLRKNVGYCAPENAEAEREKTAKLNGTFTNRCIEAVGTSHRQILSGLDCESRAMSDEDYDRTLAYGYKRASELMAQRADGIVRPNPLKGAVDGCRYCRFAGACGYDANLLPGVPCKTMNRDEFLSSIAQREDKS